MLSIFPALITRKLQPIVLSATGSWPHTHHVFDKQSALAIIAALAAERPLLIRGEPGTGKSQMARAAVKVLKRAFISTVMDSKSESQDLLWSFDAVSRLGDAQSLSITARSKDDRQIEEMLNPLKYLSPGPLWWALNWRLAQKYNEGCKHKRYLPQMPSDWKETNGVVLLIDEIDKADPDLPNGLLESLGNHSFNVPWIDNPITMSHNIPKPLVIITTNEERELPSAFVRRCMVLNLELPETKLEFIAWLSARGKVHFTDEDCDPRIRKRVAEQLWDDRKEAGRQGAIMPGQAEYLDVLRALVNIAKGDIRRQDEILKKISQFALKKFPRG